MTTSQYFKHLIISPILLVILFPGIHVPGSHGDIFSKLHAAERKEELTNTATLPGEAVIWPHSPRISPQGDLVAFTWEGDLWLGSIDGGRARRLTDHPSWESDPVWSPDGKQIIFSSTREGSRDIWSIPSAGGTPQQLTWWSGTDRPSDWFPGTRSVLMSSDRVDSWKRGGARLYKLNLPDQESKALEPQRLSLASASSARISPSGRELLVTRWGVGMTRQGYEGSMATQIWHFKLETGEWKQLTPTNLDHRHPCWITDDQFLMVEMMEGRGQLVERNLSGDQRKVWTAFKEDSVRSPSISKDGSIVTFEVDMKLWKLNRNTGELETVSWFVSEDLPILGTKMLSYSRARSASLSADGKMLAASSEGDILVRRVEAGLSTHRVTSHPASDSDPIWLPLKDGEQAESILFVSKRSGTEDFYRLFSSEQNEPRLDRCLSTAVEPFPGPKGRKRSPSVSPDGKTLAYVRGDGDLVVQTLDGENVRVLHTGWSPPSYSWSPDSRWLAFSTQDNNFNSDVWLVPVDGTRAPFNLSANPRPDMSPVWSPDGKKLAFVSQRDENGGDLWWLWLRKEDHQPIAEDRELAKDPLPDPPQEKPAKTKDEDDSEKKVTPQKKDDPEKEKLKVLIDLDGIRQRFKRGFASDDGVRSPIWGPKSKKIFFVSSHENSSGIYAIDIDKGSSAKKITTGRDPLRTWNSKKKVFLRIASGTPTTVTESGKSTPLSISGSFSVDMRLRQEAVFDEAWATMRDRFYDIDLKGLDWDALGKKYRPVAISRRDRYEFGVIINRLIGELNSSHQRFSPSGTWSKTIAATGVPGWQLDWEPGKSLHYRISEIIADTPAASEAADIEIGDLLLAIDGKPLAAGENVSIPLMSKVGKRVVFTLQRGDQTHDVRLRPISNNVLRQRKYAAWLNECRDAVHRKSAGRLGYLHIRSMNQSSLDLFAVQLYEAGHDREGLIIDVRENGGGWTTDRLLVSLTRRPHALTQPRAGGLGYPNDRLSAPSWTKPVAVICNENSYSNAEIFSHAIKNLKRGPLIGMPTSGSVISTGSSSLLDGSTIRVPFRGWYTIPGGLDMDLNGAIPDILVPSDPRDEESAKDRQLETAIDRLLKELPEAPRATF